MKKGLEGFESAFYDNSMEVIFCSNCSQSISRDYLYCPCCGARLKKEIDLPQVLEDSVQELKKAQTRNSMNRLDELKCKLSMVEDTIDKWEASLTEKTC